MKTKTLLIAAAALAAGVISSQAQVYSVNVVGYANVVTPSSAASYMLSVPFKIGVSNGANEVFANAPEYSSVLLWDSANNTLANYQKDIGNAPTTGWTLEGSEAASPTIPVGMGFFFTPGVDDTTNTFAGTIAINVGSTNNMTLASSALTYLISSVVPYAGSVTNGNNFGGGLNMNSLPEYSSVLVWNPADNTLANYQKDIGNAPTTGWTLEGSENTPPALTVGQGIFVTPGVDGGQWTVGLQ